MQLAQPQKNSITILGDGSFGTALACLVARNGYNVTLWCHNSQIADSINKHRINQHYFPDTQLPETIYATSDIKSALEGAEYIFAAIPVMYLRSVILKCLPYAAPGASWVVTSKGIEENSLFFSSTIIESCFKQKFLDIPSIVVASGPSFAKDIISRQPIAITLASEISSNADAISKLLDNTHFTTHYIPDVLGVQAVAALKNIYALGMGILAELSSDSTKALFFMHALEEQKIFLAAISGDPQTAYTYAGLGDLILTCYSKTSRNVQAGMLLAQDTPLELIAEKLGTLPEGINTLKSIPQLQKKFDIEMRLAHILYHIVYKNMPPKNLIQAILS